MNFNLYYTFRGFVRVRVITGSHEKLFNLCAKEGILLWDVKTKDEVSFFVKYSCVKKLEKLSKYCGCVTEVTAHRGVRFILKRASARYALLLGGILFILFQTVSSSLIWSINITGCEKAEPSEIVKILKDMGIDRFTLKNKIDTDDVSKTLMIKNSKLSWVGTDIKGTTLNIRVAERRQIPYMVDRERAVDIVSANDGVISEMKVRSGESLVRVGDTVIKGQILVSALVEKDGDYDLPNPYTVHSYGDIIARTWYTFDIKQPSTYVKKVYTGRKISKKRVIFEKFSINLYFRGGILYTEYDKIEEEEKNIFKTQKTTAFERRDKKIKLTQKEAVDMAVARASLMLPEGVLSKKCISKDFKLRGDDYIVSVVFECTENIAREQQYTERRETDDSKDTEN